MAARLSKTPADPLEALPSLPLDEREWQAVVKSLRLSPQQAKVVRLLLRSAANKQIAFALGISEPTVRTHLERIFSRTGVGDRMELAMRVLTVCRELALGDACPPNR
ncbi:MAG TPA: LuxR C-terminal-related transcriptional regulator [Pirellulales bacterium]|jgi:DNA-binding NarL/FixJ family response regulator